MKINKIINRISDLEKHLDRDEKISVLSLLGFFKFFFMYPNIKYPDITTTPDGDIYAEWGCVGIHLLNESICSFFYFGKGNNYFKNENVEYWRLLKIFESLKVSDIIFEEEEK